MEEYPEEVRTPPVTLVSLVGCPEFQTLISTHFLSAQPPINTLALPDVSKIIHLFNNKKDPDPTATSPSPVLPGILKRDWLLKHRTKSPALLAALFPSHHLTGDPAQWLQLCSDLDSIKALIRGKSIKFAVVVVVSSNADEISEDRMIALRKRAEVDAKYVIVLNPNDTANLKVSLHRLASTFSELAVAYYREEGRRIKHRIEKKNANSVELIVRYCFKVAVYAEFRSDWTEALKFYEEAYHTLREIVGVTTRLPAIQRLVEIKTISEQLYFKISTLLLHSGKVAEAVGWFRQHKNAYKRLVGAPEGIFLHWEWMSRQFLVFGELLETSSKITQGSPILSTLSKPMSEWEYYPAYYYQLAAHYLSEKRSALELAISMSETSNENDSVVESVVPSVYVGQFARLLEHGDNVDMLPLSDEEYICYAISEGKRFRDSLEIIALLKKAYESYSSNKILRMSSFCGFQMAREYFSEADISNAKQIFDTIATLYRKEGWVTLLWDVLGYLRECSRKNGAIKDFVEYSLEMAALPVSSDTGVRRDTGPAGAANLLQREIVHNEVFELVSGASGLATNEHQSNLKISTDESLQLEVDLVSPLRLVMLASVAFHEQSIKPGSSTLITVSLLSHLPLTVEIDGLEIQFNQSKCNFFVTNGQKPRSVEVSDGIQHHRTETAPSLSLESNKWLRLTYDIQSDQSGKLECLSVTAKIGSHLSICCRAESPASLDSLPLWTSENSVQTVPIKDPILVLSGQKYTQVEEQDPQVDLHLGASSPALVGEVFLVPVTLVSKGHDVYSGELKINLVDVKGGGLFSPRDNEPYALDSHHVQLLGISGPEGEDDSHLDSDKIKKIQQSFGLISVPIIKNGDSWSCKLEIKWHRPKPIMLYVSLGYTPYHNELNTQTVHVHKHLQIEGHNAIVLNHHYLMPFRRDPLLLSKSKQASGSNHSESLPLNQKNVLIVSAKNCTELPLRLKSMRIEVEDDAERTCSIQHGSEEFANPALLVPGEVFKKVFSVSSNMNISKLSVGTVCLKWRRDLGIEEKCASTSTVSWVMTKQKLPDVNLELPPLIVSFECPPYAVVGDPFTYYIRISNQTQLLQEIKYSLGDAQSFVLSGYHNDTIYVLPKSEHILSYKLVPLVSGMQQLPKFSMTSVRYSAAYQPSNSSNSLFIFPSKPHFKAAVSSNSRMQSVVNE
ncbi:trafficking protein particle complex subunit 11 [Vigna unguiculata]|uniref:Solute carrier family 25 n=2 Tax=Vigna unguiculata TaxID=3917 RepID=A0A4D6KWK4_VIGUN|nr:trafficking protein particle complex subunit 11 [Vigna unguiculata]QCD82178.1 solute carrier family 25 [Vigna unguiculata]